MTTKRLTLLLLLLLLLLSDDSEPTSSSSSSRAMELNVAFEALEMMRKVNLQVEFGEEASSIQGGGAEKKNDPCIPCLREQQQQEQQQQDTSAFRKRLLQMRRGGKAMPCLACATCVCGRHKSKEFGRENITICSQCSHLFSSQAIVDRIVAAAAAAGEDKIQQKQTLHYLLDVYDRALLILTYSNQFIDEISQALIKNTGRHNKVGLGSSAAGVVSGAIGVAAAVTIFTPVGPPLLLASVLFGGTSTAVAAGSESVNYRCEPNKMADKIIALHAIVTSIARLPETLEEHRRNKNNNKTSSSCQDQITNNTDDYSSETNDDDENPATTITEAADNTTSEQPPPQPPKAEATQLTVPAGIQLGLQVTEHGFVQKVLDDSVLAGSIGVQDQIIDVNGHDLSSMDLQEIVKTLQSLGEDAEKQLLVLKRGGATTTTSSSSERMTKTSTRYQQLRQAAMERSQAARQAASQRWNAYRAEQASSSARTANGSMSDPNTKANNEKKTTEFKEDKYLNIKRAATHALKPLTGGALSAFSIVAEAREMRTTVQKIHAGNPCDKAQTIATIKEEVQKLPATSDIGNQLTLAIANLDQEET